jgi:tetratricopeptide (TPR) repeat protein
MLREARALASVRHPNIVPVYGIDRHDGRVGFWTDFVRGKTLSALVGEQGTFGAREAALIGLDVARALSAVHRAGLLHRDIKAENVMREEGGRILLMDFGLSALDQRQTNISGTPNYMAPELFEGGQSTVATDIYAMGMLLYFLVSGEYPARLSGLTPQEALAQFPKRRPLIDLRPDLPESLLRTVNTALETDPAKRFSSAGQLASALAESLGTHEPVDVSVAPNQARAPGRTSKWIFVGLFGTAVLAAPSLIWYVARQTSSHRANGENSALSAAANDQFLKAQDLLSRSYKETNLAEAARGLQEVVKSDPNNALARARLGEAYLAQYGYSRDPKLLDMSKDATNRAITLNPALAAPQVTLARIAAAQGDTQLATQYVQKALDLDPRSAEAHGALGEVYEAQGRATEATAAYQKAIDLAPDDWRWPMSMGVARWQQGKLADAITQFQRAAELAPDNAVAFYDLSIAHRQTGNLVQARADLERALALDPTAQNYAALGSLLLFEGKFDQAAEMEKKAIDLNPNYYVAWGDLGSAYSWGGASHDKVADAYRRAIELEEAERAKRPKDPILLAMLAGAYSSIGNSSKSVILAKQALALAPDDPSVQYRTGEAYELLGQREAAIPLIAKALADGYNIYEFEHSPELAGLRNDPKFAAMLNSLKQKKK